MFVIFKNFNVDSVSFSSFYGPVVIMIIYGTIRVGRLNVVVFLIVISFFFKCMPRKNDTTLYDVVRYGVNTVQVVHGSVLSGESLRRPSNNEAC